MTTHTVCDRCVYYVPIADMPLPDGMCWAAAVGEYPERVHLFEDDTHLLVWSSTLRAMRLACGNDARWFRAKAGGDPMVEVDQAIYSIRAANKGQAD